MRLTADLVRWGIAVLLMVPFLALGGWLTSQPLLLWLALVAVITGGALNAAGVVRGVRRVADGRVVDDLLGRVDGSTSSPTPLEPRVRILYPDGMEAELEEGQTVQARRRIGIIASLALVALTAFGAWTLAVEQPLAIAEGRLTLDEIYAAWSAGSRIAFQASLVIWAAASLVVAATIFVLSRIRGPVLNRLLTPLRFSALCAIAGSVIVTAAFGPYFSIGNNLPDDLPFMAGGVQSTGSALFGLTGILLCCVAIVLTVPRWKRRPRR